jgi:hypothetical protein
MDTRFWGPSGWKLLHLITFDYKDSDKSRKTYADFFETIPYILPCKFCRASLTDYYRKYPFQPQHIKKWMYTIHNCVNGKLRKQGLNPSSDPPYSKVKVFYEKWQKCEWHQHLKVFWNFLFAVAYNHPKETNLSTKPMPDCPKEVFKCNDPCEKNKWNVLDFETRLRWFKRFWLLLPAVFPEEIRNQWYNIERRNPPRLECRRSTLAWLWRMRCGLDSQFQDPYTTICKKISAYSSDCGKKPRAITCRRRNITLKNKK